MFLFLKTDDETSESGPDHPGLEKSFKGFEFITRLEKKQETGGAPEIQVETKKEILLEGRKT